MKEITIYTLTYLLSEALGSYAICKFIKAFFDSNKFNKMIEIIACIGYYFLNVTIYLTMNTPIVNFSANIIAFFLLTCMYTSSIKKRVLVTLISYVLLVSVEMVVVTLTGYIDFPIAERNDYNSVFGIVVLNVLKYAVAVAVGGFKNIKNGNKLPNAYWISLFVIPFSSLCMIAITFQSKGLSAYQIAISIVAVLIINFTVFFLFDRLAKSFQEKQERNLVEQQNRYYENQLELINTSLKNSSILRHDMKNHLQSIFTDIKNGNISEAQQHISDIADVYNSGNEIIHTSYPAIDSIVNFKMQAAKQNGVRVNVSSTLPQGLNISAFDSTVIFGNLIDNALQAVSLVADNRFIDLTIHYSKGMLLIKISNPFVNDINISGDRIITSKKDKKNHGYGLTSVKETVEKYNGTIEINPDKNIFTVTAILYID